MNGNSYIFLVIEEKYKVKKFRQYKNFERLFLKKLDKFKQFIIFFTLRSKVHKIHHSGEKQNQ